MSDAPKLHPLTLWAGVGKVDAVVVEVKDAPLVLIVLATDADEAADCGSGIIEEK